MGYKFFHIFCRKLKLKAWSHIKGGKNENLKKDSGNCFSGGIKNAAKKTTLPLKTSSVPANRNCSNTFCQAARRSRSGCLTERKTPSL